MTMKITCPACGMENANFDEKLGLFICPDCGHEWVEDSPKKDKENEDNEIGPAD